MLRRQWVQDRDGFLLVYSMVDRRSFDELDHFLSLIKSIKAPKQVPLVIVANKSDLKVRHLLFFFYAPLTRVLCLRTNGLSRKQRAGR
jgi:GTPase SAR1 family protein